MSRIRLDKIPSLIFYKDRLTASRRAPPVPQLTCIGKPCKLYQPDVVRCVSLGGYDTDVSWKCEADLPEALRFGAVEVLCEGWDGPGDPYVLKGSCGLEYRLVQVPDALRGSGADDPSYPSRFSRWLHDLSQDPAAAFFMLLWVAALALILYSALSSCLRPRRPSPPSTQPPRRPWWGSGPGSGWFPSTHPDGPTTFPPDPPPPYTKTAPTSAQAQAQGQAGGWRPGFWTGAMLGGLGAALLNRPARRPAAAGMYDWEAERMFRPVRPAPAPARSWFGGGGGGGGMGPRRRGGWDDGDRGEGPSNLGSMRTSTGMGGSRVR